MSTDIVMADGVGWPQINQHYFKGNIMTLLDSKVLENHRVGLFKLKVSFVVYDFQFKGEEGNYIPDLDTITNGMHFLKIEDAIKHYKNRGEYNDR